MRIGQNPAKFVNSVAQPAEITVTVVSCVPFLSGFYEQSKEVLIACLNSLHQNTDLPFDLMVFDNHSCPEVQKYLTEAYHEGIIQYLVLSDKNIGKIGAWNYMFGAAQGKFVAFADSDIYFRAGWLPASLVLFDTFPNVGMVTGRPIRTPDQFSEATLSWGKGQGKGVYEEGAFLKWEVFVEHADSIGQPREDALQQYKTGLDHRFSYHNQIAYSGAAHFQFLTQKSVISKIMPLPSEKPMRGERAFDISVNQLGYLRLCTEQAFVVHMGNRLPKGELAPSLVRRHHPLLKNLAKLPVIRQILLWSYNQIFKLYFDHPE